MLKGPGRGQVRGIIPTCHIAWLTIHTAHSPAWKNGTPCERATSARHMTDILMRSAAVSIREAFSVIYINRERRDG